jgi:Bacterial extracellular solute-binding protein
MEARMPGRHTTSKRPSRAGPIFAAIVAVAVIVALGVYLAPRLTADGGDSSCEGADEVAIATPADLAPALDATVRSMVEESDAEPCATVDVTTVYPDSSLTQITSNSNTTPTVWILDSSARLAELEPKVRQQVKVVGKAAVTPIILVASLRTSQAAPNSWRAAFRSDDFYMHAPSSSAPESLFAIAALAAEDPNTDIEDSLTDVAVRLDDLDEGLPSNGRMIRQSQQEFAPPRLFPVTEQTYARVSNNHTDWQLTPLLPETGTVILDYPVVVRNDADAAAVDVAESLTAYVATASGNSALATAGFRGPNGRILNTAAYTEGFETFPTPAGIADLMTAWGEAQAKATG